MWNASRIRSYTANRVPKVAARGWHKARHMKQANKPSVALHVHAIHVVGGLVERQVPLGLVRTFFIKRFGLRVYVFPLSSSTTRGVKLADLSPLPRLSKGSCPTTI